MYQLVLKFNSVMDEGHGAESISRPGNFSLIILFFIKINLNY